MASHLGNRKVIFTLNTLNHVHKRLQGASLITPVAEM